MKSMLQQLDSNVFSKDGLIYEQNGKLAEKDKIIHSNQAEIERLEKRTKMQEHKVKSKLIVPYDRWLVGRCVDQFLQCPAWLFQIDILQKTTKIYEEDKRSLQQELETRDHRLQKEVSDKKRMEQRLNGVVSDTQYKWEKECVSQSFHNTDEDSLKYFVFHHSTFLFNGTPISSVL